MERRTWLRNLSTCGILWLAGCSSSADSEENNPSDNSSKTEQPTEASSTQTDEQQTDDGSEQTNQQETDSATATFELTTIDAPAEVNQGGTIDVRVGVENTGNKEQTKSVEITLSGTSRQQEVTIAPGETKQVTVSFPVLDSPDDYKIRVQTPDTEKAVSITVHATIDSIGSASQFQYDAQNSGYAPKKRGPTNEVTQIWTYDLQNEPVTIPVIRDGVLFACESEQTHAIDATTGDQVWTANHGASQRGATIATDDTALYVIEDITDGNLRSLSTEDGSTRWNRNLLNREKNRLQGDVILWDDTVFVIEIAFGVSSDEMWSNIKARNVSDGSERWTAKFDPEIIGNNEGQSLAASDNQVFALAHARDAAGGVLAMDGITGADDWTSSIYTDNDEYIPYVSGLTVGQEHIFALVENRLQALDLKDGNQDWAFDLDDTIETRGGTPSPAVTDEYVYVPGPDNLLYAIAADTGEVRWRRDLRASVHSPVVANDTVYAASNNRIGAYRTSTGDPHWEYTDFTGDIAALTVTDDVVFAATSEQIVALGTVTAPTT